MFQWKYIRNYQSVNQFLFVSSKIPSSYTTEAYLIALQFNINLEQYHSIWTSGSNLHVCGVLLLQELVDVYVEYPFFVRGRGWSSCSPQKTAHLCGLQCHQLSVGDVCLALTPISAPQQPPSATSEPETSPTTTERDWESLKMLQPLVPPGPSRPAEGPSKEAEVVRRRHQSAPELRGPGINCM